MLKETTGFFDRIKLHSRPAALRENQVICGQARFTALTPRLIRLEWASDGRFEDRATFAFPTRESMPVALTQNADAAGVEITTAFLRLSYRDDGQSFHAGNLSIRLTVGGLPVEWTPGMVNLGNLRGTRRTLDQCAGATRLDEGLLSRDGWTLFDDSGSVVWDSEQVWVEARSDAHRQDWYFFGYGRDYKALLNDYVQFGGEIPLVPRYVLGAWWSRFWAYHADDLADLVREFQAREIPLDVLVVDMDWHKPDGWTGYSWNRELFPDPEAFLTWVHAQNLYVTLNLHPAQGVQAFEDAYPEFARLIGHDVSARAGIPFRGADKAYMQPYFELLHHPLEEQGVDFWWVDWQQGNSTELKNLDPLPWLNHLHYQDSTRRGMRPMLYSRWGGLGNHRYPIGFSGDSYSTWTSLANLPHFTATAANVAYGWWSHDIGGHFGAAEPELYARWVQFGAVSPCLRLHSTKDPLAERRPWAFPEPVYQAAKAAIQFRYRLLPYLYSAARSASIRGLSLAMPMYYEYPEVEDAYLAPGQYFLGDQIIAAPIVSPTDPATGLASVDVWVPEGTWYEFSTLETFTGPRWIRLYGDLNRIPLLVRAGGVVPMADGIMQTKAFDGSRLIVQLYPGADGAFALYEDDGATTAYRQGEFATTMIALKSSDANALTVMIAPSEGDCPSLPLQRTFELHVRAVNQPAQVTVNQVNHADWRYQPDSRELVVTLADVNRKSALDVGVTFAVSQPYETNAEAEPFVHCVDALTYDDARRSLGAIVVVPPEAGSPFDVEIEWTLVKDGQTISRQICLMDCVQRQILDCPFADDGSGAAFRWSVSTAIAWNGREIRYEYQSQTAYPAISQWQTRIYDPQRDPVTLADITSTETSARLDWQTARQDVAANVNLVQPYGVRLLEQERERILAGESLEACLTTILFSPQAQDAVLYVQSSGSVRCFLDGVELTPTAPVSHPAFEPMFDSWMTVQSSYFALPLPQGESQLAVFTRPDSAGGWWGLGAIPLDHAGNVLA